MNAGNNYGFSARSLEQCRNFYLTQKQISQTMNAEFRMKGKSFPPKRLKEANAALDSQSYAYYPRFTKDEISQQSTDQLPWSHIKPVEFDGIRIQTDLCDSKPEQEEKS